MGQVLGFAHCKEAPSTASSTPDSTPEATDGGKDESDFPELHTAREFSDDEEETSLDWGTPRELTFSYITFAGSGADGNSTSFPQELMDRGSHFTEDPVACEQAHLQVSTGKGRVRAPLGLMPSDTCETFVPDLADSLENIPSLIQSPETEHKRHAGSSLNNPEPFCGWGMDIAFADDTECPGCDDMPDIGESKISQVLNPFCGTESVDCPVNLLEDKTTAQSVTTLGQRERNFTHSIRDNLESWEDHGKGADFQDFILVLGKDPFFPAIQLVLELVTWFEGGSIFISLFKCWRIQQMRVQRPDPWTNLTQDHCRLREPSFPFSGSEPPYSILNMTEEQWLPFTSLLNEKEKENHSSKDAVPGGHRADSETNEKAFGLYIVVADLVYWRNTQTSAIVCTSLVVSLLCLSQFSVISVSSYVALLVLCATITLRVYRKILQAVSKSDGVNPFQVYLDEDVTLSKEQVNKYAELSLAHLTSALKTLRHLFLVEDLVDSLKLLVLLYLFTYIGAVFNGLTLLILGVISAFSLPLLYRQHQAQIDQYVGLVRNNLSQMRAKIQAKLPSAKPKVE